MYNSVAPIHKKTVRLSSLIPSRETRVTSLLESYCCVMRLNRAVMSMSHKKLNIHKTCIFFYIVSCSAECCYSEVCVCYCVSLTGCICCVVCNIVSTGCMLCIVVVKSRVVCSLYYCVLFLLYKLYAM